MDICIVKEKKRPRDGAILYKGVDGESQQYTLQERWREREREERARGRG